MTARACLRSGPQHQRPDLAHEELDALDVRPRVHRAREHHRALRRAERRRCLGAVERIVLDIHPGFDRLDPAQAIGVAQRRRVAGRDGDHGVEALQRRRLEPAHLAGLVPPHQAHRPSGHLGVAGKNLRLDIVGEHQRRRREPVRQQHRRVREVHQHGVGPLRQLRRDQRPPSRRSIRRDRDRQPPSQRPGPAQLGQRRLRPGQEPVARRRRLLPEPPGVGWGRGHQRDVERPPLHVAQRVRRPDAPALVERKQEPRRDHQQPWPHQHRPW